MKLILSILGLIICVSYSSADQYSCVNSDLAAKTLSILNTKKEIILFCNICTKDEKVRVQIDSSYYKMGDVCKQVFIKGLIINGNGKEQKIEKNIDLAYAWINDNGVARNLAKTLDLPVINLGQAFFWGNLKPYYPPKAKRKVRKRAKKIADSLNFEMENFSNLLTKNYNGEKVQIDSVQCTIELGNKLIEITQFYSSAYKTSYRIDLGQISNMEIVNSNNLQKSMLLVGKLYVQYLKEDEVFSAMNYNRKYIEINSAHAELIIKHLKQLKVLCENYSF